LKLNTLKKIVGEDNFLEKGIEKIAYCNDASQIEGNTIVVVQPTKVEQIHKIVLLANRQNFNLVIRGAGTGLVGGAVPQNSVVLDLSKMNNILEINENEKTAVVEPGVIVDDLNYILKDKQLFFPIIPSSHEICTIGGMIATNAAGLRAVKYGPTSKWVIGLSIIDGSGRYYDIKEDRLDNFIGKEGTTGIIVKAKLKLTRPIEDISLSIFEFSSIEKMTAKAGELLKLPNLIALEFFDKLTAKTAKLNENYYLIAEFEGSDGSIKEPTKIRETFKLREGIYPNLASEGYIRIEDPKVELDKLPRLAGFFEKNKIPFFGHLGIATIHPCFDELNDDLIERMYSLVSELNGSISGEHGIGLSKKKFADPVFKDKIKKLKLRYDVNNILNKGKII